MEVETKSLFTTVVNEDRLHPSFVKLKEQNINAPTRWMLDDIFSTFQDPDGNFLEQFQTTGFNARFFELYLYAYFSRTGYSIDRSYKVPDFLVTKNGITVAVEATTTNPSTTGTMKDHSQDINDLDYEDTANYRNNELAIRFGSPLFSKLQRKYWDLDHCKNMPFVIAIEAFHDNGSLRFTDSALTSYVYGINQTGHWSDCGDLILKNTKIDAHILGSKSIPSTFFDQPDTENISAILFTNAGTSAKFTRMGYQNGIGNENLLISRRGFVHTPDHNAMDPTFIIYNLDAPRFTEWWGDELVVLHNPKAINPLPKDFFIDAVQTYLEDGSPVSIMHNHHIMSSETKIDDLKDNKKHLQRIIQEVHSSLVIPISKNIFQSLVGINHNDNPFIKEHGWFSDNSESFLGVVVYDKSDKDWGYVVFARDPFCVFRVIEANVSMKTRDEARYKLQLIITEYTKSPQRIFRQD